MPRDTPGLKRHKTPPKSDLVEAAEPPIKHSEWERRWKQRVIEADTNLEPYRREKPADKTTG
jgi:hypothetical protein